MNDPLAYGPTGIRCGCGKDAHSNLVPCQPDRPYTDEDLRAEAGLALDALVHLPTVEEIVTSLRQSYIPHLHADGDLVTWGGLLDEDGITEAAHQIRERMVPAAPVGEWAIRLGADGLQPHARAIDIGWNDGPLQARIHIAFPADTPDGEREQFVTDISNAIAGTVPVR
ncbi:hypothetical protein [Streptomyces sp. NPDC012510]|uniref:hypothetical protein n=1 Tax=Streptomyces sp. NPDC012510 TaxID=3364838 RepID=UPI0036EB27F5